MEIEKVLLLILNGLFLAGSVYLSYLFFIRRLLLKSQAAGKPRPRVVTAVMIVSILVLALPVIQIFFSYSLSSAVMGTVEGHNEMEGLGYMIFDALALTLLTVRAYRSIR
jgi:hypothetical protein